MSRRKLEYGDYTIAWISALPVEKAAAEGMLNELHENLPRRPHDHNTYTFGRLGEHNIVIACLPAGLTGTISAADVAGRVRNTFPSLKIGLMVGIGGGVPRERQNSQPDIRLGDIVVSEPSETFGGAIQYDFGKTIQNGRFVRTSMLNRPPDELLTAVSALKAKSMREGYDTSRYILDMLQKYPKMQETFSYPGREQDQLFEAVYDHPEGNKTCDDCDVNRLVARPAREQDNPNVYYGIIASGDRVMRHGQSRDHVAAESGALCFEMEAAGLMNNFPCLVIRGICDYADSHKNKRWQPYAAAAAAAFAKELLLVVPIDQVGNIACPASSAAAESNPQGHRIHGDVQNRGGNQFNASTFTGNLYFGGQGE